MGFDRRHIWKEITKEDYDKNIPNLPDKLSIESFKIMFCFVPKDIVKREVIIPEHICGICDTSDYIHSDIPKKYNYFKSVGTEIIFVGNKAQCEEFENRLSKSI